MNPQIISIALKSDSSNLEKGFVAAQLAVSGFKKTIAAAQGVVAKVDDTMKALGRRAAAFAAANAAAIGTSAAAAMDFERQMRSVNSILYESEGQFKKTSDAVLDMSRDIPKSAGDLSAAMYDIASSGFDGAEALQILEASGVAATAGMTETATASKAISGAINTWSLGAGEAGDVADILFKTVESGVVTFEELALQMSDFTGIAQAAGLELDEVSAAFAAMTLSGMPASRAGTALSSALNKIIKPSEVLAETVQKLGYESAVAMVQQLGLKDALLELSAAAEGDITAMSKMFDDVEGLRGVLALTANEGELFAKSLNDIADESNRAGAAQDAYREMSKSVSVQIENFKNSVNALRIEIGQYYLPILSAVVGFTTGFLGLLGDAPGPIKALAAGFMALATVVGAMGAALLVNKVRAKIFQLAMGEVTRSTVGMRVAQKLGVVQSRSFSGAMVDMARKANLASRAADRTVGGIVKMNGAVRIATAPIRALGGALQSIGTKASSTNSRIVSLGTGTSAVGTKFQMLGVRMRSFGANTAFTGARIQTLATRMQLASRAASVMAASMNFLKARMGMMVSGAFLVIDILQSWGSTAKEARGEMEALADEATSGLETNDIDGMREAYARLYEQLQELNSEKGMDGSLGDAASKGIKGGLELFSPFNDNNVQKGFEQINALAEELGGLEEKILKAENAAQTFGEVMGLTEPQVRMLADKLGIDLTEGTELSAAALRVLRDQFDPEALRIFAENNDDIAVSLLIGAQATDETATAMSGLGEQLAALRSPIGHIIEDTIELTDAQKNLQQASGQVGSFSSALSEALQRERDAAQEAADEELEVLQKRSEDNVEAAQEGADKEMEALERASEDRVRAKEDEVQAMKDGSAAKKRGQEELDALRRQEEDSLRTHREAREDELEAMRDREKEILDEQGENLRQSVEEQRINLEEAALALIQQNFKLAQWQQDLVTVAGRTSDEVAQYLASMGEEGVDLVHEMATGSEDEVKLMQAAIEDNMKLTGDKAVVELDAGMKMAELAAKEGAEATRDAILDELGLLPGDVDGVMQRYGQTIEDNLNRILTGLDMEPLDFGFAPPPNEPFFIPGTRIPARATGGIDAHFATQPTVLYGERSTGGEAFIPLGFNHRARSIRLWEETGRLLGVGAMANGGLISASGGTVHHTSRTSVSKRNENVFTGDIYASDPKATIQYAERRKRQRALAGRKS